MRGFRLFLEKVGVIDPRGGSGRPDFDDEGRFDKDYQFFHDPDDGPEPGHSTGSVRTPADLGVNRGRVQGQQATRLPRGMSVVPPKKVFDYLPPKIKYDPLQPEGLHLRSKKANLYVAARFGDADDGGAMSYLDLTVEAPRGGIEPAYVSDHVRELYKVVYAAALRQIRTQMRRGGPARDKMQVDWRVTWKDAEDAPAMRLLHDYGAKMMFRLVDSIRPGLMPIDQPETRNGASWVATTFHFVAPVDNEFDWRPNSATPEDFYAA
jgi:hypothetical protein